MTLVPSPSEVGYAAEPTLFRPSRDDDRAALERLVRETPGLEVVDTYAAQVAELLETRQPRRTFAPGELQREADALLARTDARLEGVWIYYPWDRRVVHLLEKAEFVELRTSRNKYKITADEQAALATKRIGVVGLSVGHAVAMTLAQERVGGELRLADYDGLSLSNLNRLRGRIHELGIPKVRLAARHIAEMDPYIRLRCFDDGITDANIDDFLLGGGKLDLLVEECDDLAIKIALRRRARQLGIPVLMDTSDRGLLDIERFDLEPDRPLLHGLVPDIETADLRAMLPQKRVELVAALLGADTISPRAASSLREIGSTIRTWPQLASGVSLGGAVVCDIARRILLGELKVSGRFYVDLEAIISDSDGHGPKPTDG